MIKQNTITAIQLKRNVDELVSGTILDQRREKNFSPTEPQLNSLAQRPPVGFPRHGNTAYFHLRIAKVKAVRRIGPVDPGAYPL